MEIVADRFQIIEKIGSGSFGNVYKAKAISSGELVALKIEKYSKRRSQLRMEERILRNMKGIAGFPQVKWFGYH